MIERVLANSYRVVEKVGEGGMGAVYRAVDLMLDRDVAIKAIKPELSRDPEMVERFRTEARTLARVSHPCIATIYSFFQDGGDLFLALEFVRGRSLSRVLETEGALPWDRAVRILGAALDGIGAAHRAGVIHRDLKPDNLMITGTGDKGSVKVTDFGIARMAGSGHLTRTGLMVGTLRYMAPEQIQGEEADARSDIYSLGAVLYQMLTGRPAFEGKSDYAILKAQIEEMPAAPSTAAPAPGIPEWLDRAVLRALAKKPADRFQSVEAMRRFLDTRGASEAVEEARPFPLVAEEMEELPTVVTPPRPVPPPLPPLPPIPTIPTAPSSRPAMAGGDAKPGMSPVVLPTMASGAPPVSTDVGLYQPVPAGPKRSGLGWKLAVGVAAVLAVLTGAGLGLLSDDSTETAQETPADVSPEPTPADEGSQIVAGIPEPTVEIAPSSDSVEVAQAAPVSRPRPTPAPVPDEPTEAEPEQTTAVYQPPVEPEPSPTTQAELPAAPIEELKQLGADLQNSSARFFETYQAFLEQKENGGGEITDDDEELEELIESFAGSAERFNKQIQGGGFLARLRKRGDTEAGPQLGKRAKDLADRGARVDALIARTQPSAEVRQAWLELRQRWQRAGRLVTSLQ